MRIDRKKTLGIIVDMQEKLIPHIYESEKLIKKTGKLINGLHAMHVPMIMAEQYKKGLGETTPKIKELLEDYPAYEKTAFSLYREPSFEADLSIYERDIILLAGVEAHICILQTAIDLKSQGYTPIVVLDCISSRFPEDKEIAIKRLIQEGVLVTSLESILFELLKDAKDEAFKAISNLVK